MSRVKHEIRLDLSGVDLSALNSVADLRRAARKLLPAALEDLGQAMGEVAWLRSQAHKPALRLGGPLDEMRKFVAEAGKKYRRHAPDGERQALEELIMLRLQQAKTTASERKKKN